MAHGARRRRPPRTSTPSSSPPPRPTACSPPPPATCRRCSAPTNAAAFDISAACPGFVYALTVAEGLIASGQSETVARASAPRSCPPSPTCRTARTAILFGDGAGAAVVRRADRRRPRHPLDLHQVRRQASPTCSTAPAAARPTRSARRWSRERSHYIKMAGREVFKAAVLAMAEACDEALQRAGVTADEIDLLVPHQANLRIIEATAKHAGMPMDKVMVNVDRYGNTSSASIPLALDAGRRRGPDQAGHRSSCWWRSAPASPGAARWSGGERR